MTVRKIIHVDMDAFYASVEQRDNPELKGKPVVVGGHAEGRGVVAAASYEARKFGVRSAMSSAQAKRLCPQLIFVTPHFSRYSEVSQQIRAIFAEATDRIEPLSLDEAYLDVTENKLGQPLARDIAVYLKARIREVTGLTASAGVGPNKFIAKIASDMRKPNGLVVVAPSQVEDFVRDLAVEKFWGVGPATAKRLHGLGIFSAADLRRQRPERLIEELGKFGSFLVRLAHGEDDREVESDGDPKSRGSETTFEHDILDPERLMAVLREQAEEVAADLKEMVRPAKTISIKVRYANFETITRARTLHRYTDDARTIARVACDLMLGSTEAGVRPIRLVGLSVSGFVNPDEPLQLWFEWD